MDNLIKGGNRLHADNWYTSYELCKVLLDYNTDCIRTLLRVNRKQLQLKINAKKLTLKKLKPLIF